MPFFGQKRSRTSRAAALRASASLSGRIDETLRDRRLVLRLLLCLLSIVAIVHAVQAWKAQFPYRLGDRADHGITAKIDFQRLNVTRTNDALSARAKQVPFVFENDPKPLTGLAARLRSNLTEVAEAETPENLRDETRAAFGFTQSSSAVSATGDGPELMNRDFATLKAAIAGEDGTAGARIDEIVAEFERFIEPVLRHGLASADEFVEYDIPLDQEIEIPAASPDADAVTVYPADVLLAELVKETGLLGKSWQLYPELALGRQSLERWLLSQAPITLHYDNLATKKAIDRAQAEVEPVTDDYNKGDLLVPPGGAIDQEALDQLRAEYDTLERQVNMNQQIGRVVTVFLLILVLAMLNGYYIVHNEPQLVRSISRLSLFLIGLVLAVFLGRLFSFDPWRAEIIPLIVTVMVFAIAYNQEFATLIAFTLSLIITLSTSANLGHFVVLMSVATAAVIPLARVPSRSILIKVGFFSGMVYFVVSWGTGVIQSQTIGDVWTDSELLLRCLRGAGYCLVAGYLVAGSLPFIESTFGVVTDISLLELSDISHPLLQELVRRAPGTYNHSISVATIGEAAADRIGANGLLVRVGAYFHDVGKMLKPHYFIENMMQGSESRHEHLAPAMSTLIIIGHVKDGVDLARQQNLPQALIDFIEQHHGTTLVEYFYYEATRQADQRPDHKTDAEEASFRYPGPKPQSREAGVLMLADAIESASRTLSEPTPKRIERLVHEVTLKRLLDGQFDESSLTLSEIHAIEDSLNKSLIAIYHGRIKYPEQQTA
jgi:hypothetical protein